MAIATWDISQPEIGRFRFQLIPGTEEITSSTTTEADFVTGATPAYYYRADLVIGSVDSVTITAAVDAEAIVSSFPVGDAGVCTLHLSVDTTDTADTHDAVVDEGTEIDSLVVPLDTRDVYTLTGTVSNPGSTIRVTIWVEGGQTGDETEFPFRLYGADIVAAIEGGPDLTLVEPGFRALIYGDQFAALGFYGTYDITDVSISYLGSDLVAYFEIDNPVGLTGAGVEQDLPSDLAFFWSVERTVYHQPRQVIVTQSEPRIDITVPATTQAVGRIIRTAAYLVANDALETTSVVRRDGLVRVTTQLPHNLTSGDTVIIDGAFPTLSLPAVTAGVPAGSGAGGYGLSVWGGGELPVPPSEFPQDVLSPVVNFDGLPNAVVITAHLVGEITGMSPGATTTIVLRSMVNLSADYFVAPILTTMTISSDGIFSVEAEFPVPAGTVLVRLGMSTDSATGVVLTAPVLTLEIA